MSSPRALRLLLLGLACGATPSGRAAGEILCTTFSIAARDAASGDLGVAVATMAPAAGAVVPWVRAEVGAVASQAWVNPELGPRALDLLASGVPPRETLAALLSQDAQPERRQLGMVDARGASASHTGRETLPYAGAIEGFNFSVQGNLVAGRVALEAMAESFQSSEGRGLPLAERLLRALEAGQAAGGDRRGGRSAALLCVAGAGARGSGGAVDLRVDDHDHPVEELRRIYDAIAGMLGHRVLSRPHGPDVLELQRLLRQAGLYRKDPDGVFDDATVAAVQAFRKAQGLYAGEQGGPLGLVDADLIARLRAALEPDRPAPARPPGKGAP